MVAPGNAGIAKIADCVTLDILDGAAVLAFVRSQAIDFVIIGPEAPWLPALRMSYGPADVLCFGPSQAAAQLEASKFFTKSICDAAGAPTAGYAHFTDLQSASDYVRKMGAPIVVKADGLAAGKGVIVATSTAGRS
jgi:phosphoribosylamine--glycine ligase